MSGPARAAHAVNKPFFPIELSWGIDVRDSHILDGQAVRVDWKIGILIVQVASCGFCLLLLFFPGIPGCSNVLRCGWCDAFRVAGRRFCCFLCVLFLLFLFLFLLLLLLIIIIIRPSVGLVLFSSRPDYDDRLE